MMEQQNMPMRHWKLPGCRFETFRLNVQVLKQHDVFRDYHVLMLPR
jgi:hypothetical protein